MTATSLRRALVGGAGLVLVAGLVAVVVHDQSGRSPSRPVANAPATTLAGLTPGLASGLSPTTSALPSLPSGGAPASEAGATPGATTTLAGASTGAAGASEPGPVRPTSPGTYDYTEHVHSSRGDSTTTLVRRVANQGTAGGEQHQTVTDTGTDPSSGGQATTTEQVGWRADGFYLHSQDLAFGGSTYHCNWSPAIQQLALPLSPSRRWALQGSCQVSFLGRPLDLKLTGSAEVTGTDRVVVGGQTVEVWVVASTIDVTGSGALSFTLHQDATHRIAPAQGLEVSESSTTTSSTGQGGSNTVSEQRQLRSLSPS